MGSINPSENPTRFILTAEDLNNALPDMHMATRAIHADDFVSPHRAIAPGMHTAVNFRYARDPDELVPEENKDPDAPFDSHIYSRYTAPNSNRLEILLRSLMGGEVITYSSGLSAFHAMLVLLNPKRIFIGDGYHGCHSVVDIINRLTGIQKLDLTQINQAGPGDIIHVETPLNPTGEARNLAYYRAKASEKGAYLTVDSTFAPPPLQNPLDFGADIVLHSGTKYVGGHSDMLCGVLVIHPDRVKEGWLKTLRTNRQYIGSVMGSFEGWLGIRSARTMQLRVARQAQTAKRLARWLQEQLKDETSPVAKVLSHVQHASLQEDDLKNGWLQKQMPGGFGPAFAVWTKSPEYARRLPSRMFIFQHATSLGGVESLMEWRAMSDARCDHRLLRISCGIEEFDDLKADIMQGLESLLRDFP
ncbi:cystathionine beta-lyase [Aspergillus novofumigatus IBT 16806]|uniref:Cystathionine beta-lyase n=1 Tax=Aspergillus novofumigatus (strain IBT 16806) TaxID=1392255 RepID=A0A2I1BVB2_ASPN1|nr:cystathionine beta-lyase [Aspergillus novofumigatus IBT 16806]PKX89309.1 cystathionine beta-lyase [Aspergillus novofumigatus IBT 16806]